MAAGVAADNVICAVYFIVLFALASKIPPEASKTTNGMSTITPINLLHHLLVHLLISIISKLYLFADSSMETESDYSGKLPVLQTGIALATAFLICKAGTYLTTLTGIQGGSLPAITAIVVILATVLPKHFGHLAPAGDAIALILMQVTTKKAVLYCISSYRLSDPRIGVLSFVYEFSSSGTQE